MNMNERLKAAVYGFAVGDALGVPYEFKPRGAFKCKGMTGFGTWDQLPGTWSDDTSMVLATCDSIRERRCIDPLDIMQRFAEWRNHAKYTAHGEVFDIGTTTEMAIDNFAVREVPAMECGVDGEYSAGNGSLMRILPLAFTDHDWQDVDDVSALTHADERCKQACKWFVYYCEKLVIDPDFPIPKRILRMKQKDIESSGYVVTTLEAALWCFGTSKSYSEAVLRAVNLGGDTDTIAALTGALSGIKWGINAIPKEWVNQLANKELIDSCLF